MRGNPGRYALLVIMSVTMMLTLAAATGAARSRGSQEPPRMPRLLRNGECSMAPQGRLWPRASGCLSQRVADVEGRGRLDRILLYQHQTRPRPPDGTFTLKVVFGTGRAASATFGGSGVAATIISAVNVDGRPGAEVFVHEQHISTDETIGLYSYVNGGLHHVGVLRAFGGDQDYKFSYTCAAVDGTPAITQSDYQRSGDGNWTRTDTVYLWSGGFLLPGQQGQAHVVPPPARLQIGEFC